MLDVGDIWLSSLDAHGGPAAAAAAAAYEPLSLEEIERRHILATLEHTEGNKSQAAAILSIERSTLDRKLKGYNRQR